MAPTAIDGEAPCTPTAPGRSVAGVPRTYACAKFQRSGAKERCSATLRCGATRRNSVVGPGSPAFPLHWCQVGHVGAAEIQELLERCSPSSFSREQIVNYSHDEDALNAFVYEATGWQPGAELLDFDRDRFLFRGSRLHATRGFPLQKATPEAVLKKITQEFETRRRSSEQASCYSSSLGSHGETFVLHGSRAEHLPPASDSHP